MATEEHWLKNRAYLTAEESLRDEYGPELAPWGQEKLPTGWEDLLYEAQRDMDYERRQRGEKPTPEVGP